MDYFAAGIMQTCCICHFQFCLLKKGKERSLERKTITICILELWTPLKFSFLIRQENAY